MKKLCSFLLVALSVSALNPVMAKTDNNPKPTKTGTPVAGKSTETVADPIPDNARTASPGRDSATDNFINIFYEPKKKRLINIQDIYVGLGGGFSHSNGASNTPFANGISLNASYGLPLYNKRLLFQFSNSADFMFSPDKDWFSGAYALPQSQLKGIAMGFNEEFNIDLQIVIAGSKTLSWTAGPLTGARLTNLPSVELGKQLYHLSVPVSFCYGLKTNLFIGYKFSCYLEYANMKADHLSSYVSQQISDAPQTIRQIPFNSTLIRVGVSYILKPWW